MSRLKGELEKAQSRNAELEKSAAEEKQLRVEETRKLEGAGRSSCPFCVAVDFTHVLLGLLVCGIPEFS